MNEDLDELDRIFEVVKNKVNFVGKRKANTNKGKGMLAFRATSQSWRARLRRAQHTADTKRKNKSSR